MKYIVNSNQDSNKIRNFCSYSETNSCNAGNGHGSGNYANVEVGI